MFREYLTERGSFLLNTNLVITFFLGLVGIHIFRDGDTVCTPGTNLVGDSFIDCEYDGEQETIPEKLVLDNPNPDHTADSGHLRLCIRIVFVNIDSASFIRRISFQGIIPHAIRSPRTTPKHHGGKTAGGASERLYTLILQL